MSALLDKCKKAADSEFIDWAKCNKLNPQERINSAKYEVWGMVKLALYILSFEEYCEFKQYIYIQHGYDVGGVTDGQIELFELY